MVEAVGCAAERVAVVVAIGHARDHVRAEEFASVARATPTAAGELVRDAVKRQLWEKRDRERATLEPPKVLAAVPPLQPPREAVTKWEPPRAKPAFPYRRARRSRVVGWLIVGAIVFAFVWGLMVGRSGRSHDGGAPGASTPQPTTLRHESPSAPTITIIRRHHGPKRAETQKPSPAPADPTTFQSNE